MRRLLPPEYYDIGVTQMSEKVGFFTGEEKDRIASAIASWHTVTTGEIRVYVDSSAGEDIIARANSVFEFLGLHKLPDKNGALLYIGANDGVLLVLGGAGINRKVLPGFWDRARKRVEKSFLNGDYLEGALHFIDKAGTVLRKHYPEKRKLPAPPPEKFQPVEKPDLSPAGEFRASIKRLRKRNAKRLIKQWYSLSGGHGRYSAFYQQEHSLFTISLFGLFVPVLSYLTLMVCLALFSQDDKRSTVRAKELQTSLFLSIFGSITWTVILISTF